MNRFGSFVASESTRFHTTQLASVAVPQRALCVTKSRPVEVDAQIVSTSNFVRCTWVTLPPERSPKPVPVRLPAPFAPAGPPIGTQSPQGSLPWAMITMQPFAGSDSDARPPAQSKVRQTWLYPAYIVPPTSG